MTRYLKICPRGFANEVTYLRVAAIDEPAAERLIRSFDGRTDGYAEWTADTHAHGAGVAVEWAGRAYVGIIDDDAAMTPAALRSARQSLGMSQSEFARALDVASDRTVRRWEEGERDIPGPVAVLMALAAQIPAVADALRQRARTA